MRNACVSILLLLLAFNSKGQETERVVRYTPNKDKETFYVLKSDTSVRHGEYEKKGPFSHTTGFYKNGKKDGVWIEYSSGSRFRSRGSFANNERVGDWKYYDWAGELEQEYNYDSKEVVYDALLDKMKERKFSVIQGSDTVLTYVDRPPLYIGGKSRMQTALTKGSNIATILRLTQVNGNVTVGFTIDTSGHTRDYRIVAGLHPACDTEAMRMVQQLPSNWIPAKLDNRLTEVQHTITIAFKNMYE